MLTMSSTRLDPIPRTVILLALLLWSRVVAAEPSKQADGAISRMLAVCASCHGVNDIAVSDEIPSLGGQN